MSRKIGVPHETDIEIMAMRSRRIMPVSPVVDPGDGREMTSPRSCRYWRTLVARLDMPWRFHLASANRQSRMTRFTGPAPDDERIGAVS
jgi:hypothetical protein